MKQTIQRTMVIKEITHQKKGYELRNGDSDNKECTPYFLEFKALSVSKRARTIPKKKVVAVAATAQIKVHVKSGKKVPAIRPCKTSPKLEKPTQSKSDLGAG